MRKSSWKFNCDSDIFSSFMISLFVFPKAPMDFTIFLLCGFSSALNMILWSSGVFISQASGSCGIDSNSSFINLNPHQYLTAYALMVSQSYIYPYKYMNLHGHLAASQGKRAGKLQMRNIDRECIPIRKIWESRSPCACRGRVRKTYLGNAA